MHHHNILELIAERRRKEWDIAFNARLLFSPLRKTELILDSAPVSFKIASNHFK